MSDILIRTGSGSWQEPADRGYALETELQVILAAHPHLIPGVSEGAVSCREFVSAGGHADLVVVDVDGTVTLVECKLAKNPEIRREIVGQMFDYASSLWKMSVADFDARWRARNRESLFQEISEDDFDLKEAVAANLAEGRFRIVLAVDAINSDLKRMVEYLNAMSGPTTSVIAVEYTRLSHGDIEILLPRTFGQELAEVKATVARPRDEWPAEKFRDWLASNDSEDLVKFDQFVSEAAALGIPFVGSTAGLPSGGLRIYTAENIWIGTLFLYCYSGTKIFLEFSFTRGATKRETHAIDTAAINGYVDALARIRALHEVANALRTSGWRKRPNIPLSLLSEEAITKVIGSLRTLLASAG